MKRGVDRICDHICRRISGGSLEKSGKRGSFGGGVVVRDVVVGMSGVLLVGAGRTGRVACVDGRDTCGTVVLVGGIAVDLVAFVVVDVVVACVTLGIVGVFRIGWRRADRDSHNMDAENLIIA